MSTQSHAAGTELTPYESAQIEQIATWKSLPPNPFAELFKHVTMRGADLVEKVIPDLLVRTAIEKAYTAAQRVAGREDIVRQAGVRDIAELRHIPLELCDRLASRVSAAASWWATVEGAATGAGGVLTTVVDVPLLFVLALRTILRIGHCYGYALDHQKGEAFVLGILVTSMSGSLATRRERLDALREIERLLVEETQEEILTEEAFSLLFQLEIFEGVPGVGAISGALLNLAFIRRVDITAQHVFQERWLHDNGKVRVIAPAPVHERHLVNGWRGAFARAAHSGMYSVGFGMALPVHFVASVVRSTEHFVDRVVGGAAGMAGSPSRLLEHQALPAPG